MKFIFISLLVTVILSFVQCGLIIDFLGSVSKDAHKIRENVHNSLVKDHNHESTTEHSSRGIIGNVLGSIENEIKKVSEIRKSIHQDIYNKLHKKSESKEEGNHKFKPDNKTIAEIQDNENISVSKIHSFSSEAKNDTNRVTNDATSLTSTTVVSAVVKEPNSEENLDVIKTTTPLIDIRHISIKPTSLKPKTTTSEVDLSMTLKPEDKGLNRNEKEKSGNSSVSSSTDDKKNTVYLNTVFDDSVDSKNISGMVTISKQSSAKENPVATVTTSPSINVLITPKTTTINPKIPTSEVEAATDFKNKTKDVTSIDKHDSEVSGTIILSDNDKVTLNTSTDSSNTPGTSIIFNKTSVEENPEAIETTNPLIDVRLRPIKPATFEPKSELATSHKNDKKSEIIDVVVFPDELRKRKIMPKESEKTRVMEKNNVEPLSQIVFRDPDKPVVSCPPDLVMKEGTCTPDRDSFKGDCPSGTQRADDDTCQEVIE